MKTKFDYGHECAFVSAIISDHIAKSLYKKVQAGGEGYMATIKIISQWTMNFVESHRKTNWDLLLQGSHSPISKAMKNASFACFDDVVIDYAYHKLETFNS